MNFLLILLVVFIAVLVFYFIWAKITTLSPKPDTDTTRLSRDLLPVHLKENDKVVVIEDVSYPDLKNALTGFCNMYNKESYAAQPRLFKLSETEFAITFPYDMDFATYCYFINYMYYPMEITWNIDLTGWTTMKESDEWVTEKSLNKKVMLFVPPDDTEHDNVYITTSNNIGYKLGFAVGEEKKLLDHPKKNFRYPTIDIEELANKEFEDIK